MSALGMLLAGRLSHAAGIAAAPGDRAACAEAAEAARRICELTARGEDDRGLR
jgi:hypothetical protein